MELKLNTLTKTYGKKKAVDSVTVNLTPGVYGLLGPNGAGKTTLMHMLCGLMKPTVGTVYFDGTEISVLKEQYRNTLGFLPQNFGYYPDFSVKRFLSYLAYLKGLDRGAATDSIRAVLETTGLTDLADSKIVQLSGGMRQRVGIAQALLNNPDILILDEPTVGLDPAERVRFRNLISSVSCGKITILSTHIVPDVSYIAEQILLIHNGKILYKGSVEMLTEKVRGRVWEAVIAPSLAECIAVQHTIRKMHHTPQGVSLRILAEKCPFEGAQPTCPDLEDAYLFYTGQKGGEML